VDATRCEPIGSVEASAEGGVEELVLGIELSDIKRVKGGGSIAVGFAGRCGRSPFPLGESNGYTEVAVVGVKPSW